MKKLLFIFVLCYFFISCNISGNNARKSISLWDLKPIKNINELLILQDLIDTHQQETIALNNYSPYNNILRIAILFMIIVFVLVIVSTPLILVYFLIANFFEVQKIKIEIKKNHSSLKLIEVDKNTWLNCKNSYSAMYGNGFGVIAWILFTYFYISTYYTDFNTGLKDYFRFPFKIINEISNNNLTFNNPLASEIWISMLLIVGVSALCYFMGNFIGRFISTIFYEKTIYQVSNNSKQET